MLILTSVGKSSRKLLKNVGDNTYVDSLKARGESINRLTKLKSDFICTSSIPTNQH